MVVKDIIEPLKNVDFSETAASVSRYAEVFSSLTNNQRVAAGGMLHLSQSQQVLISKYLAAVPLLEKMTIEEFEAATNIKVMGTEAAATAQKTDRMTESILRATLAAKGLGDADIDDIFNRFTNVSGVKEAFDDIDASAKKSTTVFSGFTGKAKKFAAGLKEELLGMVATPLGKIGALLTILPIAIQLGKTAYDYFDKAAERAYESAEEQIQAYQDVKSEIESLTQEKADVQAQISELELAGRNGQTINQEDLNRLRAMNTELNTAIAQKERLAKIQAIEASESYGEAYSKRRFQSISLDDPYLVHGTQGMQFTEVDYETHIKEHIDAYSELNEKRKQGIALTEEEQQAYLEYEGVLLSAAEDLRNNYKAQADILGDSESSSYYQGLIDNITKATDETGWFVGELEKLPSSVTDTLEEYGQASELTEGKVVELIRQFPELADWMARTGVSANQLASYFDTTGASTDALTSKAQTLEEALNTLEDEFNRVEAAQNKYNAAMEEGDYDQNFRSYADAYKKLGEEITAGTVGREFWAGAEFFFGADQLREWEWSAEKVAAAYKNLQGVFGDADSGGFGILDKLYELERGGELVDELGNKLMEISKTAEGGYDFEFDSDYLDELSVKLGITEEALLSCIEALQIWGDIDLYDMDEVMGALKTEGLTMEYTVKSKVEPGTKYLLEQAGAGGTVDLTMRPVIDTSELIKAGWSADEYGLTPGDTATVFTSTYSNEAGTAAINVTPILTDGNGRPMGVLSPEKLEEYANEILAGGEDKWGIQIGAVFTGEDAIEQAEKSAEYIHELQAEYYNEETFDIVNLDEVRNKLSEAGYTAREIDDVVADIAADASVISFDSQGTADELLGTLEKIGAVSQDEAGMNLVNVDTFNSFLRQLGYAEEEIEAFYKKFEGRSDVSLVDSEGMVVSLNEATKTATKNAKKQKGEVEKQIELFRELNNTAAQLDPSSDEFLAVTQEIETLKTYFDQLPDAVKQAFSIDPSLYSSGIASITQTLSDYKQAVLDLQALEVAQANGVTVNKDELDAASQKVKDLYTQIENIPDIETKANIDLESLESSIREGTFEIPDISVNVDVGDAEGAMRGVESAINDVGTAAVNASKKKIGLLGAPQATSAVQGLYNQLTSLTRRSWTVTVTTNNKTSGAIYRPSSGGSLTDQQHANMYASGTDYAPGGWSLTGELGPELVWTGDRAYLVGRNGPEVVNLERGSVVYTADETKKIFRNVGSDFAKSLPSFVSGTINKRPASVSSPSSSGGDKTTKVKVEAEVDKDLSDALKDELDKLKEELEEIIGNFEHEIFLEQRNGKNTDKIIANYKAMQDATHKLAEQYRAKGLDENSDYIQDLQKQWWEYEDAIVEAISTAYEEARSLHENDITLLENSLEDAISVGDVGGMREYTDSIIDAKKAMRSLLREQIAMYRAEGLADNSDEITEAMDLWHDLGTEIEEAAQQIIDSVSDMVDEVEDAYNTLHKAADEYAESGYITVDTLQDIISLGPQYLAFLIDENGQLVINEERINSVIKARTEQLAIETALNYVKQIRTAVENGEIATLNNLLYATQVTTGATWELVYANLALAGLNGEQYAAAMRNINALRALSITAQKSIGQINKDTKKKTLESLEEMQDGMENIVDYVMDMLADRLEQQIDALEEQKDQYADIIDLKKESLEATKAEDDYQKSQAEKLKKIAKLQAQIELLKLDDSREAQARRIALEEELAELQGDLADEQADKLLETQTDTLDKMQEANEKRVDAEIEKLEKTASSYEKRWQQAIDYIENNWSTLHKELLAWNHEYGDVLNSEITDAYNAASTALQKYGSDFSTVLGRIRSEIDSLKNSMDSSFNTNLGSTYTPSDDELAEADKLAVGILLSEMKANSAAWDEAHKAGNKTLEKELADANVTKAKQLEEYGIYATKQYGIKDGRWNGVWYDKDGTNLYQKYAAYIYHKGGVVGGGDIKANEQIALLENEEWVLSRKMVDNLSAQMERINTLRAGINTLTSGLSNFFGLNNFKMNGGDSIHNVTTNNSTPIAITIGDTIISGADQSTIQQHVKVSEDMVNQIARVIGIRR